MAGLPAESEHPGLVPGGASATAASGRRAWAQARLLRDREFEDKKLGKVHAPTLIIWGHDDALIPLPFAEKLNQGIAGSQLVVLDGAGHIPMVGKPQEFNETVRKFLSHH